MRKDLFVCVLMLFCLGFGCDDTEAPLEGCEGLASRIWECEVFSDETYELITEEEYAQACQEAVDSGDDRCLDSCDLEAPCSEFNACFVENCSGETDVSG